MAYREGNVIQFTDLNPLNKISGDDTVLIATKTGEAYKVTVDTLLGYIAKEINAGTLPDNITGSGGSGIVEIPIGEDIPERSRIEGNVYLRACNEDEAQLNAGLNSTIVVSPNMALEIVN